MSLIRFNQDITLAFITTDGNATYRGDFVAGEFGEFAIENNECFFTLRTADGSYAPFVGRDVFDILPEGFELYRFTRNMYLSFGILEHGHWIFDIGSAPYMIGSLHAFKLLDDTYPKNPGRYALGTINGNIIPEVPKSSIELVSKSSEPFAPSPKASKQVLESFPAPVPGEKGILDGAWSCPYAFNSLRVLRDPGVPSSLLDCSESPVAYLRLEKNNYGSYIYCCSFFGVPPASKLAKV